MILLDAYALLAFLAEEPAADEVEELLRRRPCGISVVNLAEAVDAAARADGLVVDDLRRTLDLLVHTDRLQPIVPDGAAAWRAAQLRETHFGADTCHVSLGDCFLVASARPGDEIATADPALAAVARGEGLGVIALPDSAGRTP